ncbi:MAG: TldD/PmbA family protein [bacterium]|nr:TldD/PmbA family protein [bacterium]
MKRAVLSGDFKKLRKELSKILPLLEQDPKWHVSVFAEKRASCVYSADLRKTNVSDNMVMGAVLRVYNGYTLFEEAVDDLSIENFQKSAKELVTRVKNSQSKGQYRPYKTLSWKERLKTKLDPEISSQIPENPGAGTEVHFGISYVQDPAIVTADQRLQKLKDTLVKVQDLALKAGLKKEDITFVVAREGFGFEESIYIDRESNISQAIYRQSFTVVIMSGEHRVFHRVGGLGGREIIDETKDKDLLDCLKDLKGLQNAGRLKPGRYRVVFGPDVTGVLAHEAFGHSQEGDTCARGRSQAWELYKSGEKAGNQHATIINNPAIYRDGTHSFAAWGSYFFDEEGWLAAEHVLIEEGKLEVPMTNFTSALRLGISRTANGKRESFANGVYTRQTNTYFKAGKETLEELLSKIDYGFLAMASAGGMEDPKGMGIQVGIAYLEEVKNGKLTGKIFRGPAGGDIQMTGYTPDVLNSIIGVSKVECETADPDHAAYPFNKAGGCGKYHKELVVAGCGGPYLLLDQVILG